jgi:hypothetical protein
MWQSLTAEFSNKWTDRVWSISWPLRSPGLSQNSFGWEGRVKNNMYSSKVTSLHELKGRLQLTNGTLERTRKQLKNKMDVCRVAYGAHTDTWYTQSKKFTQNILLLYPLAFKSYLNFKYLHPFMEILYKVDEWDGKLFRIWKEPVLTCSKALFWHLAGDTDDPQGSLSQDDRLIRPKFKPGTSDLDPRDPKQIPT